MVHIWQDTGQPLFTVTLQCQCCQLQDSYVVHRYRSSSLYSHTVVCSHMAKYRSTSLYSNTAVCASVTCYQTVTGFAPGKIQVNFTLQFHCSLCQRCPLSNSYRSCTWKGTGQLHYPEHHCYPSCTLPQTLQSSLLAYKNNQLTFPL